MNKKIQWNVDSRFGEFLSRKGVEELLKHSQQQLLEGLSKKVKPVEEGEAMFKDDKDGLLSEGYTIGWNECVKQVKALIQEEKERL